MKSPRNKTLEVSNIEVKNFSDSFRIDRPTKISELSNKIIQGDLIDVLPHFSKNSVDLIIADPPYNLGKEFGRGKISMSEANYRQWCQKWIAACHRVLKPSGSMYVCIDWSNSCMFSDILKTTFEVRNRITWKRDKGRGAKNNWKNNMEDIWYVTKSDEFTFNLDEVKVKRPVIAPYVDTQGQAKDWFEENGEKYRYTHPANIWTDLVVPFWSMAENTEHPTQKPEKLIERLIKASSNKDDIILDPFMGSGTTAVVAKRLRRKFIGIEIEKKFIVLANKRLKKSSA